MIRMQQSPGRSVYNSGTDHHDTHIIDRNSNNNSNINISHNNTALTAEALRHHNKTDGGNSKSAIETMLAGTIFRKHRNPKTAASSGSPRRRRQRPRGGGSKTIEDHDAVGGTKSYYGDDFDFDPPGMIESPGSSASSSGGFRSPRDDDDDRHPRPNSSPPPQVPHSSSSRMQERYDTALRARRFESSPPSPTTASSRTRRRRNPHRFPNEEPSNTSILAGASIIRRQLSEEGNGPAAMITEEWDPWNPGRDLEAKKLRLKNLRDRALDRGGRTPQPSERRGGSSPRRRKNHERVQAILSAGDTYFDQRAKTATEAPRGAVLAKTPPPERQRQRSRSMQCGGGMVRRLSELDDSTFASSSESGGGGGYLPPSLLSGLSCGALVPRTTCAPVPQPFGATLPAVSPDEELETKTLDFLANLHAKEEDLDFLFRTRTSNTAPIAAAGELEAVSSNRGGSYDDDDDDDHRRDFLLQTSPSHGTARTPPQEPFASGATEVILRSNSSNILYSSGSGSTFPRELASSSHVTEAATPFEKLISARSPLHASLLGDPGYRHALSAGTLWQSLCSQHVRFPAHWWDGAEPIGPPLGSCHKIGGRSRRRCEWDYLGRNRLERDATLQKAIGNRASSGRILLHLVVFDAVSGSPAEDIALGAFHPNARGIRTTSSFDPALEGCRDVWIAHRRRVPDDIDDDDDDYDDYAHRTTTLGSLLRHQNRNKIFASPLGGGTETSSNTNNTKHAVNNTNLRLVFGSKPPVATAFCEERELFEVFREQQQRLDGGSVPASVALLRHYLGGRIDRHRRRAEGA